MICPVTGQICTIDFYYQKDEHVYSAIDLYPQLTLGEIVMACEHPTLILAERTIYKDNILVSDVDVIMCPECGYFALARMKKKELKKAKRIAVAPSKKKVAPKPQVAKVQPADDERLRKALNTELGKLGVTPKRQFGADKTAKPTGVNNNPPVKATPSVTPQDNLAVKGQGADPLKTEGKKTKKK